jgi:hypothetical protein
MSSDIENKRIQLLKDNNLELLNETKKLSEENNEITIGKIQLDSKVELTKYYRNQINTLDILSWVILCVGVLLIFIGFYFWYIKIQKPNDLILANQANEQNTQQNSI